MNQQKYLPRSTRIFENKNVWLTLFKVMLPNVLSALVNGLYGIVTQIFLNRIVPYDGVHNNLGLWKNYDEVAETWNALPWKGTQLSLETSANVVHSAVAISLPVVISISAIALWISMGLSLLYGTAIGKKKTAEAHKIWTSWFFPSLLFCGLISVIFGATLYPVLYYSSGAGQSDYLAFLKDKLTRPLTSDQQKLLTEFYQIYYHAIVHWALDYSIPVVISLFLQVYVIATWFCLAAEGKQTMMLLVSVVCNLVNVGLDFLLMKFAQIGMLSGGLVVVITFSINALILVGYLCYLNKHTATLLTLNLLNFEFGWKIFYLVLIAGIISLLQNITNAFAIWIFHSFLIKTSTNLKNHPTTYWLNFSGATMPILNLLSATSLGIVHATRILFAYHLPANNFARIKKIFWIGIFYSLVLSGVLFLGVANRFVGSGLMQTFFGVDLSSNTVAHDAFVYWRLILSGIIAQGLIQIGIALFQSAGRILRATTVSLLSGVGTSLIVLPLMSLLAIHYQNDTIYLSGWTTNAFVGGLSVFGYTIIYLSTHLKPGYQIRYMLKI